ncbi:MAG: response regulator transcription factor [Clostridia bacterium]|uniref:response regulator transcription factor n=1 Tax=Paraclostridium sp. TaxID=2023273 RepID=UPI003A9BA599
MNIKIISKSFIMKEVLKSIVDQVIINENIECISTVKEIDLNLLPATDFILIDLSSNQTDFDSEYELEAIKKLKESYNNIKVLVVDLNKNARLFNKALKCKVDGYTVDSSDKDEFLYIINKVIKGKKYYDGDLVTLGMKSEKYNAFYNLTQRELDILKELGKGFNNREIATKLYITEHTVKKHVSNILQKINCKNRKQAIIYVRESYMYQ